MLNAFGRHAPPILGTMPLEIRGNEADPDDLLPHAAAPYRVDSHIHRISSEDELLHNNMNYSGTASWLRYMPRMAGLRVDSGSDELPAPPQWLGGEPPAPITGPAGVQRVFKDQQQASAAQALQRSADAAQSLADSRRYESAARQIVALDPASSLPVMMRSAITAPYGRYEEDAMSPVYPPGGISGQDVNAIDVPPGALTSLVAVAPRTAWQAADAVLNAVSDQLDAPTGPGAKKVNADLNLQQLAMPPILCLLPGLPATRPLFQPPLRSLRLARPALSSFL